MARSELCFSRLALNHKTALTRWYIDHLFETRAAFSGSPHVLWTGPVNQYGYAVHTMNGRQVSLNGYLLYKSENFRIAPDESIVTTCGVSRCLQTHHMRILLRGQLWKRTSRDIMVKGH